MRSEGLARECKVVEFDLGGVEDAQEERKVRPHAEEEPDMNCESDGREDGERVRLSPRPRTPSKAERERHVLSHMPFRDWCRHCVAGRGLERQHQKHPQYPLVCIDCGYLSGDGSTNRNGLCTPLRERELRTRMQLRSWQRGWTCWDRHRWPYAAMENQL